MAKPSPTSRTLDYCRNVGWTPAVTERWNPHAMIRQDLYGFLDLVVLDGKPGLLGIQATTQSNAAARMEKIQQEERAKKWLAAGLRVEVWGWRKIKGNTKRLHWAVRRVAARLLPDGSLEWDDVDEAGVTVERTGT